MSEMICFPLMYKCNFYIHGCTCNLCECMNAYIYVPLHVCVSLICFPLMCLDYKYFLPIILSTQLLSLRASISIA